MRTMAEQAFSNPTLFDGALVRLGTLALEVLHEYLECRIERAEGRSFNPADGLCVHCGGLGPRQGNPTEHARDRNSACYVCIDQMKWAMGVTRRLRNHPIVAGASASAGVGSASARVDAGEVLFSDEAAPLGIMSRAINEFLEKEEVRGKPYWDGSAGPPQRGKLP